MQADSRVLRTIPSQVVSQPLLHCPIHAVCAYAIQLLLLPLHGGCC